MNPHDRQGVPRSRVCQRSGAIPPEYAAEFVGGGQYLDPKVIEWAATLPPELPARARIQLGGRIDPAFSNDPFGLVIVGQPVGGDWRRLVVGCAGLVPSPGGTGSFEERRSTEDAILDEVIALCGRYQVSRVVTDQYCAPAIVHRISARASSVRGR